MSDDKKVCDVLVKSAMVKDIIETPGTLYHMMCEFIELNRKFNELKMKSQFIWHWRDPKFLNITLAPTNNSEPHISLSASVRACDETLNITVAYFMPEEYIETHYLNKTFIKFIEIYREQLFRFIYWNLTNGSLIGTRYKYMEYVPNLSGDEYLKLYRKYAIPEGDDREWDPRELGYRSLQQIIKEEKEENNESDMAGSDVSERES
jgi:hypothetical protein